MCAQRVQDLLVRVRPEGVNQTTEELSDQSDQFEETADTAEEQTGKLEAFSERWQGAMGVVAAGIGIAAGALASKVPVLGSALDGLDSVFTAIGLQIDQLLRDFGVSGDILFNLSDSILELEGRWADLSAVIGPLAVILKGLNDRFSTLLADVRALGQATGEFANDARTELPSAFSFIGDRARAFGETLQEEATDAVQSGRDTLLNWRDGFLSQTDVLDGLTDRVRGVFDLASDAVNWGRDTITSWRDGIRSVGLGFIGDIRDELDALNPVSGDINAFQWGSGIVEGLQDGVENARGSLFSAIRDTRDFLDAQLNPASSGLNPYNWGQDLIDKIVLGLNRSKQDFFDTVDDLRNYLDDQLSFDIVENDRMAARWGSDFVQHFSAGMAEGTGGLSDPTIEMPDVSGGDGHAFAGRGEMVETRVELDGREIARAVGDRQSGGVDFRGRF